MWKLKITEDYYFGEMKKYYKYIFCVLISSAPVGQIFISTLRDKAADISFLMPPSKLKSFQGDRSYRVNSLRSRIAKTAKFSGFSYFVTFQRFTDWNANCEHIEWFTRKSHEIKVIAIIILYFFCFKNR